MKKPAADPAERIAELEAELETIRSLITTIFAHIPASFYVKNNEGRYMYGSPYGFALFGVDGAAAIGKKDSDLFPPALAERFVDSDRRVLEGQEMASVSYDLPVLGEPRHFAGVRFPIPNPDGTGLPGICGFAVDVTERIELAKKLEKLATTDALTGLANRRRFDEYLAAELARAARSGEPLTLLMCDVDHFKKFNDRYGHQRGDACLVEVARVLASVGNRPADLAARQGGEEFALVLPGTSAEGAATLAERLRVAVHEAAIEHGDNDGHGIVTLSSGVVTVIGSFTQDEIVGLADRALYRAKDAGRDRFEAVAEERVVARER